MVAPAAMVVALGAACSDAVGPLHAEDRPMSGAPVGNGPAAPSVGSPLSGLALFVDAFSSARITADAWRASRPSDAAIMAKIAAAPQAKWFGDWNANVEADVARAVGAAAAANSVPVLVAYNIPQRDCGSHSAGGASSADSYRGWIAAFARGLGARRALVVLEPDALAGMDCLSQTDRDTRTGLLAFAVKTLRDLDALVYLDGGHSNWHPASVMAPRLRDAGIGMATGFALNVSNFQRTASEIAYGNEISALTGGKHYIVDTSRNGLGPAPDGQWCNPEGRALGERPTSDTGTPLADAFLWIKTPGESDGACNGHPAANTWMPEYALGLGRRAGY